MQSYPAYTTEYQGKIAIVTNDWFIAGEPTRMRWLAVSKIDAAANPDLVGVRLMTFGGSEYWRNYGDTYPFANTDDGNWEAVRQDEPIAKPRGRGPWQWDRWHDKWVRG